MQLHTLALSALVLAFHALPAFSGTLTDATFHSNPLNANLPVNIYRPDGEPPQKWLAGSLSAARP